MVTHSLRSLQPFFQRNVIITVQFWCLGCRGRSLLLLLSWRKEGGREGEERGREGGREGEEGGREGEEGGREGEEGGREKREGGREGEEGGREGGREKREGGRRGRKGEEGGREEGSMIDKAQSSVSDETCKASHFFSLRFRQSTTT